MFSSHQKGKFAIKFPNGVTVSVIWGSGSYSDNHDIFSDGKVDMDALMGTGPKPVVSTTAEVMVTSDPSGRAVAYVEKRYGGNPAGYLTPNDVVNILNFARMAN